MTSQRSVLSWKAVVGAILCNVLFGSAFPAIKLGYAAFSIGDDVAAKLFFAGVRFFLSGVFVFCVSAARNKSLPRPTKASLCPILLVALFYTFLQYLFFYLGLANTTGSSGSIITSSSSFIAVILSHFFTRDDKINAAKIVGCVLGFAGVLFAVLAAGEIGGFSFFGEGFVFFSAVFFVIGSMLNKRAAKTTDCFTVTSYNLLIGGALLILAGLTRGVPHLTVTWQGALVLLWLCAVSAIGFTVWSDLVMKYPLGTVSVFGFLIPVSGTLLSALVLGESILLWQYPVALVLVTAGILAVNYGKQKPLQ